MTDTNAEAPETASTETSVHHDPPAEVAPAEHAPDEAPTAPATPSAIAPKVSPQVADGHQPFEAWAKAKKTPLVWVNAARAAGAWAIGRELTEQAYDAAINAAQNVEMR
jgi:hypothetical protein